MIKSYTVNNNPITFPKILRNYDYIKILGCGSTCVVVLVEDRKTKEKFAAKIISKKDAKERKIFDKIQNEIDILKSLNHPNIIKIIDSFEMKRESFGEIIVIITEHCENGTILEYVCNKKFKNNLQKKKIVRDFVSAIIYLHKQQIAHGDIKAENILLDKDLKPKLCDFGFVHKTVIAGDESKCGSLYYAAPELFQKGIEFNTLKADIYALGVLIYSIEEGQFPFIGDGNIVIFQKLHGLISVPNKIDKRLLKIFFRCISIDPNERPSIEDIIEDDYFTEAIISQSFEQKNYTKFENLFISNIKTFINSMKRKNETLLSVYENIVLLNSLMNIEDICLKNKFKTLERIFKLYILKNYNNKIFIRNRKIERSIFSGKNGNRNKKIGLTKYDFNKYNKTKPVRYIIPNEKSYNTKKLRSN